jgi:hypothetical protein
MSNRGQPHGWATAIRGAARADTRSQPILLVRESAYTYIQRRVTGARAWRFNSVVRLTRCSACHRSGGASVQQKEADPKAGLKRCVERRCGALRRGAPRCGKPRCLDKMPGAGSVSGLTGALASPLASSPEIAPPSHVRTRDRGRFETMSVHSDEARRVLQFAASHPSRFVARRM